MGLEAQLFKILGWRSHSVEENLHHLAVLFENDFNVNCRHSSGLSPISFMLDDNSSFIGYTHKGMFHYHHAVDAIIQISEYLIQKGADVNFKNADGTMPLTFAALCKNDELTDFFIEKGANIQETIPTLSLVRGQTATYIKEGYEYLQEKAISHNQKALDKIANDLTKNNNNITSI